MPSATRDKTRPQVGRRADRVQINLSVEREARDLLDTYSGDRAIGRFIARLVFEHHARVTERQRIRALLDAQEEGRDGSTA